MESNRNLVLRKPVTLGMVVPGFRDYHWSILPRNSVLSFSQFDALFLRRDIEGMLSILWKTEGEMAFHILQHGHEIYWCNTTHLCMKKEINWGCFQGWRGVAWWKELCTTVWYCKRHAEYLLFFGPVLQKVWYLLSLSVLQCSTTWFLERSSVIERFLLHYLMFTQPNLLFQINNPLNLVWSG